MPKRGVIRKGEARKYAALLFIIVLFVLVLWGLLEYFEAVFAALVFAPVLSPLYQKIRKRVKSKSNAALLTIGIVLLLIIIPALMVGSILFTETSNLYAQYSSALRDNTNSVLPLESRELIGSVLREGIAQLKQSLAHLLTQIAGIVVHLFIMFFLLFYLLINEDRMVGLLQKWLPFHPEHNAQLVQNFVRTCRGFVAGQGLIAVLQGIAGTLGFLIFRVEGAVFFGFLIAIFSLLPMIGSSIVWVPLGILQLFIGNTLAGIGILAWGLLVTSNIDNIVQPLLMENMTGVHPVVTVLGVFSGLAVFGLAGFIIGPLLLSLAIEAAKMFRVEWYG